MKEGRPARRPMLAWVEARAPQGNESPDEHQDERAMELLMNGERGPPSGRAGLGLVSGGAGKNTLLSVRTPLPGTLAVGSCAWGHDGA